MCRTNPLLSGGAPCHASDGQTSGVSDLEGMGGSCKSIPVLIGLVSAAQVPPKQLGSRVDRQLPG